MAYYAHPTASAPLPHGYVYQHLPAASPHPFAAPAVLPPPTLHPPTPAPHAFPFPGPPLPLPHYAPPAPVPVPAPNNDAPAGWYYIPPPPPQPPQAMPRALALPPPPAVPPQRPLGMHAPQPMTMPQPQPPVMGQASAPPVPPQPLGANSSPGSDVGVAKPQLPIGVPPAYLETADAIASDARGWEVEPGVVNVRLLLLKSRDMRRKLRAAMHHATRPRQLLNHNEAAKVQRRDHFAARLSAMERTARACGMLPPTPELILAHALIFREQEPDVPTSPDTNATSAADPQSGEETNSGEGALWSAHEIRPLFAVRLRTDVLDLSASDDSVSSIRPTIIDGVAFSCADSAASDPCLIAAAGGSSPIPYTRNFIGAVTHFQDGRMCPSSATRAAIHAALYRKFVLSAAFHADRVQELAAKKR